MEHDEKPLPIDIRLLGALAEKVSSLSLILGVCPHDACVSLFNTFCSLKQLLTLFYWIFFPIFYYLFHVLSFFYATVSCICKSPTL